MNEDITHFSPHWVTHDLLIIFNNPCKVGKVIEIMEEQMVAITYEHNKLTTSSCLSYATNKNLTGFYSMVNNVKDVNIELSHLSTND